MKIIEDIFNVPAKPPYPVVTIGNFDGVHRGHAAIFKRVVEGAAEKKGTSLVYTFQDHPVKILRPEKAPTMISTLEQKIELIERYHIDWFFTIPFTPGFASKEPETFIRELRDHLAVKEIMVSTNFYFGLGARGNITLLEALGEKYDYRLTVIPPIMDEGAPISSSRIRHAIREGRIEKANALLGRDYFIDGAVVTGDGRGKTLNFPTANLLTGNELIPPNGVYLSTVEIAGKPWPAVTNIGVRPTFDSSSFAIELHILDFSREIYGEKLRLSFVKFLRGEKKFGSIKELTENITADVETGRKYFRAHPHHLIPPHNHR